MSVFIKKGERTTLNIKLPNNDVEGLKFSVSVSSWLEEESEIEVVDKSPVFKVNDSDKSIRFAEGFLYWNGSAFGIEDSIFKFSHTWNNSYLNVFHFCKSASMATSVNGYESSQAKKDVLFAANGGAVEGYTVLVENEWKYLVNHYLVRNSSGKYEFQVDGRSGAIFSVDGVDGDKPKDSYSLEEWETARAGKYFFLPFNNDDENLIELWTGVSDPDQASFARTIIITASSVNYNSVGRGVNLKILLNKVLK